MRIEYLADHPAFIPTLARWHHAQWSYLDVGVSVEQRMTRLRAHLAKRQIPTTFVALGEDTLFGSASLIAHDMDTRMELSPWLASVYVASEHRRRGVGTALVQRVVKEARVLGVETLYLFTPDKEGFYARLGWSVVERIRYRGYQVVVMALPLCRSRGGSTATPMSSKGSSVRCIVPNVPGIPLATLRSALQVRGCCAG